ncbi:MAG TPA: flavin reductase [Spirochaetota bacterium]|nr:flavin reductase [Spirochaetota bacterium]HQE59667.1 flavin reductase [Spirochaetota bacterium]
MKTNTLNENIFDLIANQWGLLASGDEKNHNCMTFSWGGMGHLWSKDIVYIYVRPQRFTYEFIEANPYFSINFFDEKYKDILKICGTKSGREIDKKNLDLTPLTENGCVYYKEAKISAVCRNIYYQDINPSNFLDAEIDKNYTDGDYHRMYIGEIVSMKHQV